MPETIDPRLAIGGNSPPATLDVLTTELLADENKDLLAEWEKLKARATWRAIDPDTGREVWTAMIEADLPIAVEIAADARDLWHKIDERRKTRKTPFDAVGLTIQGFFLPQLLTPISEFGISLTARLKAENKRLNDEAEQRRKDLEAAARKHQQTSRLIEANADRAPIVRGIDAGTVADREARRADELTTQAGLTTAKTITGAGGAKLATRTYKVGVIVDFDKALAWAAAAAKDEIQAAVQAIVDRTVNAKLYTIPGVKIEEEESARVSRRAR